MRPITQQLQTVQALEAAGASRQLAEAIAATVEVAAQAARDAAWERIEAKLDSLGSDFIGRVEALRAEMNARFGEVNSRFDKMDVRFGEMEARIAQVEARLEHSFRVTTVSLVVFVVALAGLMLAVLRFFPAPN